MSKMSKWRPLNELDRFFDELTLGTISAERDLAIDMYQENNNIIVEMQVPGINPDKIDIIVEGDILRILGSREEDQKVEDRDYYRREIKRGNFERTIRLPFAVDKSKTQADIEDGTLKIVLTKKEQESAHKIKAKRVSKNTNGKNH